jgi:hypothetical protein
VRERNRNNGVVMTIKTWDKNALDLEYGVIQATTAVMSPKRRGAAIGKCRWWLLWMRMQMQAEGDGKKKGGRLPEKDGG